MSTPKAKPRLGRGLSSLISVSELPVEASAPPVEPTAPPIPAAPPAGVQENPTPPAPRTSPAEVPITSIRPNPHQPRKQFDEASLLALAASIKASGLVQPVVVRPAGNDHPDTYELIAGERRLRAAKAAGLDTVPVIVRSVDAFEQAQMALVENIQREDLNPIDRAQAYRTLIDQLGLTQVELAHRLGEDRSSIANFLRLLDLTEPVREMVRNGQLTLGHAKILAGLPDPAQQEDLANRVVNQGLSVRNLERSLQEGAQPPSSRSKAEPTPHVRDLERSMTSQLGMRVQLRSAGRKGKGKLVIHYGSLDEFDQLLEKLGCKTE